MYWNEHGKVDVECYCERCPTSEELRSRLLVESISEVMRTGRLHWSGHVEKKNENDWVKPVKHFEVEGKMPVGRLNKTWNEVLKKDPESKGKVAYNRTT